MDGVLKRQNLDYVVYGWPLSLREVLNQNCRNFSTSRDLCMGMFDIRNYLGDLFPTFMRNLARHSKFGMRAQHKKN